MIAFWIRALLSGLIVAAVSGVARRAPAAGALLASLPLVSLLGMIWLWHDHRSDTRSIAAYAEGTVWYVLPSLPMFVAIPMLLRRGVDFWPALAAGCVVMLAAYLATIAIAARFGVRL